MAVCMLGLGQDRTLNNYARRFHTRVGGYQQVHKVDRVQANHNTDRVVTYIYDILHHFGFPNTTIMELGSNFHSHQFWDFYERRSIEVKYVSVAHP
jgi:hypothetical protein